MTRKHVKVTNSVKALILETAKVYKYFRDLADPLKNRDGDWKDWRKTELEWMGALMSECTLCGLSGDAVSRVAQTFGGLERMENMTASEFAAEFKRKEKEAA